MQSESLPRTTITSCQRAGYLVLVAGFGLYGALFAPETGIHRFATPIVRYGPQNEGKKRPIGHYKGVLGGLRNSAAVSCRGPTTIGLCQLFGPENRL